MRLWIALVCFAAGLYCLARSFDGQQKVEVGQTIIECDLLPQTYKQVMDLSRDNDQTEHPAAFAAWTSISQQNVKNPVLNKSQPLDLYVVYGNSSCLSQSLAGISAQDTQGCLMDANSAYKLFGTKNVRGQSVVLGKQVYIIREVVHTDKPMLMVAYSADLAADLGEQFKGFTKISVLRGRDDAKADAHELVLKLNIMPETLADFKGYGEWTGFLWLAAAIFFGAILLYASIGRNRIFILLIPVYLFLCRISWKLPEEWIPTRWSDFDFWSRKLEEKTVWLNEMFIREKSLSEGFMVISAWQAVYMMVLGGVLLMAGVKLLKIKDARQKGMFLFAGLLLGFAIAAVCGRTMDLWEKEIFILGVLPFCIYTKYPDAL